ncbi:hypothetical protein [Actinacidiphila rubida]|uniref:Uncharacterized protein n=1 Tax=Actinacidiphila rubida TaxID=310780 RepID=A0A1H8J432_9ACTN|nr:hypothetical protein [Actinacidiphila rubida]SEN75195.1 hypothetical protein SAMN05216267_1009146 [Actinacidiphila rubida]
MEHGGGIHGYAAERRALTERGRPGTPVPGRYGPGDCCLHVVAALLVLFALVAGGILWSWHRAMNPPGPDIEAVAGEPGVRAADLAVTRTMDGQLDRLRAATPWAQPLGTSVTDFCSATLESAFMSVSRHWTPAGCVRETALYVAFDGDLPARLRQLDTAVGGLPWQPTGSPAGSSSPLRGLYFTLSAQSGQGTGTPATPVPPEPVALTVPFSPRPPESATPGTGPGPETTPGTAPGAAPDPAAPRLRSLLVSVTSSPALPEGGTWDGVWAQDYAPSDRPYGRDGRSRAVYRVWHPLSTEALAAAGYAHHRYLATFVLSASSPAGSVRGHG